MQDRAALLRAELGRLVDGRLRWGAAVITRDGIPVAVRANRPVSEESFAAMAAAMVGAADAALQEWSDDETARATIEARAMRLTVQALDRDFLLAVAGPVEAQETVSLLETDAAVVRLRDVLRQRLVVAR